MDTSAKLINLSLKILHKVNQYQYQYCCWYSKNEPIIFPNTWLIHSKSWSFWSSSSANLFHFKVSMLIFPVLQSVQFHIDYCSLPSNDCPNRCFSGNVSQWYYHWIWFLVFLDNLIMWVKKYEARNMEYICALKKGY